MSYLIPLLMSIIVLLFLSFGGFLKYKRDYSLISKEGTASDTGKQTVDVIGLSKFIGNCCFIIAGILVVAGIADHLHIFPLFVISIASLFFFVAYILFRIPRFDRKERPDGKSRDHLVSVLGVLILVLVVVGAGLIYGSLEQNVCLDGESIDIGGLYGTSIDMNKVRTVSLLNSIPLVKKKTSAFDFGGVLKGEFELEERGGGRLYVDANAPLFIDIKYNGSYVILNYRDSTRTRKLYESIKQLLPSQ